MQHLEAKTLCPPPPAYAPDQPQHFPSAAVQYVDDKLIHQRTEVSVAQRTAEATKRININNVDR